MDEADLRRALGNADRRLNEILATSRREGHYDQDLIGDAHNARRAAQIELAKYLNQDYAEALDLGVEWQAGAPFPAILVSETSAVLFFRCIDPSPLPVDPMRRESGVRYDEGPVTWGIVEFIGRIEIRFGGPNEEGFRFLDLYERGLRPFQANIIRNSQWLEARTELEQGYRSNVAEDWDSVNHYYLAFHDTMVEALAYNIQARCFVGRYREAVDEATAVVFGPGV